MKGFFQEVAINSVALYTTLNIFSGLAVTGGFWGIFTAAILITIGFRILKPVINIITLPLNVITFGLFQALVVAFIVFLITLIYPQMQITEFQFEGAQFFGIIIQPFFVSLFLSYIIISVTIYLINRSLFWLFDL